MKHLLLLFVVSPLFPIMRNVKGTSEYFSLGVSELPAKQTNKNAFNCRSVFYSFSLPEHVPISLEHLTLLALLIVIITDSFVRNNQFDLNHSKHLLQRFPMATVLISALSNITTLLASLLLPSLTLYTQYYNTPLYDHSLTSSNNTYFHYPFNDYIFGFSFLCLSVLVISWAAGVSSVVRILAFLTNSLVACGIIFSSFNNNNNNIQAAKSILPLYIGILAICAASMYNKKLIEGYVWILVGLRKRNAFWFIIYLYMIKSLLIFFNKEELFSMFIIMRIICHSIINTWH